VIGVVFLPAGSCVSYFLKLFQFPLVLLLSTSPVKNFIFFLFVLERSCYYIIKRVFTIFNFFCVVYSIVQTLGVCLVIGSIPPLSYSLAYSIFKRYVSFIFSFFQIINLNTLTLNFENTQLGRKISLVGSSVNVG